MPEENENIEHVFLDTNTFYDYNHPDKIGWKKVFPNALRVRIVILPVNNRELGDHKDSGRKPQLSERATAVSRLLDNFFDNGDEHNIAPIKEGLEIYFEFRDPPVEFPLNYQVNDDHLIAGICAYREAHPECRISLFTRDRNLKAKARSYSIPVRTLPKEYELPVPADPRTQEIKLLRKQNEELRQRFPDLKFTFPDSTTELKVYAVPNVTNDEIYQMLEEEKKRTRHLYKPEKKREVQKAEPPKENVTAKRTKKIDFDALVRSLPKIPPEEQALHSWQIQSIGLSDEQIDQYNTEIDAYYIAYCDYLMANKNLLNSCRRTILIQLLFKNDGAVPATDIMAQLEFSSDVKVELTAPEIEPPAPPEKPEPYWAVAVKRLMPGMSSSYDGILDLLGPSKAQSHGPKPNVIGPGLMAEDAKIVAFKIGLQKHKIAELLNPFYLTLPDGQEQEFNITYRIHANEAPNIVEGTLHVGVQYKAEL